MLDFITVLFIVAAAVGYTYIAKNKKVNYPNLTEGPSDHNPMPEMEFVFPLEPDVLNASAYAAPGMSYQVGAFSVKV